jgi:aryl-alcohol dehydrogenase-like predicted oxidoreductase
MVQKIALGTVQFGVQYGINNKNGILSHQEIDQILKLAVLSGINLIDTAPVYGDAEEKIGRHSDNGFKIVTKLPARQPGQKYSTQWLYDAVLGSTKRLNVEKIHGLLLHRPADILQQDGEVFFSDLQTIKKEGLVDKIGISIYEPSELEGLFKGYFFDIVQAPFNILDRRMIDSGWMERLHNMGIEFHARSVFLQGLLLTPDRNRPEKFKRWDPLWNKLSVWLKEKNITPLQACITYALSFKEISKVIVGIDSVDHLGKILQASNSAVPLIPSEISTSDTDLLNPLSWLNF